jgi:hypothetical protein
MIVIHVTNGAHLVDPDAERFDTDTLESVEALVKRGERIPCRSSHAWPYRSVIQSSKEMLKVMRPDGERPNPSFREDYDDVLDEMEGLVENIADDIRYEIVIQKKHLISIKEIP